MRKMYLALALLLGAAGANSPVDAQPQSRVLNVPASAAWQHAQTQMILPAHFAGFTRGEIKDLGEGEMDVVGQYAGPDGMFATVYLFRTTVPNTALWFDRALAAVIFRPEFGLQGASLPAPAPFARPGATVASGLRITLNLPTGDLRSTGIAVVPLGDHLLKVRISAPRLDRAALDTQLTLFMEGLRWPAPAAGERAASMIQPCPDSLRLRRARLVRTEMADTLMDALGGLAAEDDSNQPPPVYCRETGATLQYGVYRPDRSRTSYLIALNDAGIALSLDEAISLGALFGEGGRQRRIAMTLKGRDSTSVLPSFNRLPPPEQAMAVAFGNRGPTISVSTGQPLN